MDIEVRPRAANKVDTTILRYADSLSAEEISEILGGIISPAGVAAHAQKLLKSRNWLTELQEEQLLMLRMRKILAELEGKYLDLDTAKVILAYLKEIGNRLDKRRAANDDDLNRLYNNQGAIMARAYDIALTHMRGRFSREIDVAEWDTAAREALQYARAELEKYEVEA